YSVAERPPGWPCFTERRWLTLIEIFIREVNERYYNNRNKANKKDSRRDDRDNNGRWEKDNNSWDKGNDRYDSRYDKDKKW
ncbi:hypothetical protein V9K67_26390, partial [Paraflavisolibacter sp. H34]|uniref:hypothetical protein n=1 Tax=Huijunlia imazamoxiresistens TaxID=3127457 RepID=UPI00301B3CB6